MSTTTGMGFAGGSVFGVSPLEQPGKHRESHHDHSPGGMQAPSRLRSLRDATGCTVLEIYGDPAQLMQHVQNALPALVRIARQALNDDAIEGSRNLGPDPRRRRRKRTQNRGNHRGLGLALKGTPAGSHLVEQGAKREYVRPRVDGLAFDLLGGHIG